MSILLSHFAAPEMDVLQASRAPARLTIAFVLLLADVTVGQKWKTEFGSCYRDCTLDPEPRLCRFVFTEENYATLSLACKNCTTGVRKDCFNEQCVFADGVERTIYTINRQMPGPSIQVCVGDTIQVDVVVALPGHAEAIHWHGLPQVATPWYDGVAWVTQCPILFGTTFRYRFLAEPGGTYFYHSHSGPHKVNGILGSLIIRVPDWENPHINLYDYDLPEHVIFLQDWMHVPAEFVFPGLLTRLTGQPSDALLINGQGRYMSPTTNQTTSTPLATFVMEPGKKYRFRIINSGSLSCPIQLQFEGHSMLVISADGLDIEPKRANTLITFSGERWDVVIQARTNPGFSSYWIYARTVGFCTNAGASEQLAVLTYKGFGEEHLDDALMPTHSPPGLLNGRQLPRGTVINTFGDCEGASQVCATELSSLERDEDFCTEPLFKAPQFLFFRVSFVLQPPEKLFAKDNYEPFLAFGRANLNAVLNNITYKEPSAPFLTQPGEVAEYCHEGKLPRRCLHETQCVCPHRVTVQYGMDVDLLVVDETKINPGANSTTLLAHPMHLHGTSFACMGTGTLRNITDGAERARHVHALYNAGLLTTHATCPALKDVMALPGAGWIWLRFRADNRGAWFFHCHFQYHMLGGMEAVIEIGESTLFPKPPRGFPKCGNFIPSG